MEFQFDNDHQTIMGVPFKDPENYWVTRDAILINVYEGWQPTVEEVKTLRDESLSMTPVEAERYQRITGQKPSRSVQPKHA